MTMGSGPDTDKESNLISYPTCCYRTLTLTSTCEVLGDFILFCFRILKNLNLFYKGKRQKGCRAHGIPILHGDFDKNTAAVLSF
jgi:hypothetical protein